MEEDGNLQFILDDMSLLEAENNILCQEIPSFDIELADPVTVQSSTSVEEQRSTTTVDQSRFPLYSNEDIEELMSNSMNKHTERATKQWQSVFKSWCESRNREVDIETMAATELDSILTQFYVEVKRKDGNDYEPETLRVMQSSIDRYLKKKNYPLSIVSTREFHRSQQALNAKAISLRQQGKGKRPNKAQPLSSEEEEKLWSNGQLGDFNAKVLTNANFKILTEQLGFRGRQEHYDAFVEDFVIRTRENGSESVEFSENPTKTRSGGLRIAHRTSPQVMWSTDGGERDPVRLFKLWLSKRPAGMKENGPLYLGIVNRPKSNQIWYCKMRMGQNTIGNIMKNVASCLSSEKKITNHSMRKTLVAKLKKSGQPRHLIKKVTGHARESSLDDYDEVDETQRRTLSHIISGYETANPRDRDARQVEAPATTTSLACIPQLANSIQSNSEMPGRSSTSQSNPSDCLEILHQNTFPLRMAAFNQSSTNSAAPSNFNGCTFNFYGNNKELHEPQNPAKKRRRAVIYDSDDDDKEN